MLEYYVKNNKKLKKNVNSVSFRDNIKKSNKHEEKKK